MKKGLLFLLLAALWAGCASSGPSVPPPPAVERPSVEVEQISFDPENRGAESGWWDESVFYEIFIRSFNDSDGDGIGDIQGIIERLDYLNDGNPDTTEDLGITGIWLMPLMESPSYHGYDVTDYYSVNPDYGTMEDLDQLLEACHERGIKVIIDLVMNHTGSGHPWFTESARSPENSKRDWYVWADSALQSSGPWGQGVWHNTTNGYYYGVFYSGMPDLNYNNSLVTESMFAIIEYWLLDRDVDGFRLDAIRYLKEDGDILADAPSNHDWFRDFYTFYKSVNEDSFTVGEVWSDTDEVLSYTGDQVDACFEFELADEIKLAVRRGSAASLYEKMYALTGEFPEGQYATFLANHDQPRVLTQLGQSLEQMKMAAAVQMTLPGIPFIYYGEEIGMIGGKPDENIRRPMQWDDGTGFTEGRPWEAMGSNWPQVNAADQAGDPESLLVRYRELVQLRSRSDALSRGVYLPIEPSSRAVFAFLRYTGDETLLVIHNLSNKAQLEVEFSLDEGPFAAGALLSGECLYGQSGALPLSVNSRGGIDAWIPFASLAPRSTTVYRF